jgi:hypothetical protein
MKQSVKLVELEQLEVTVTILARTAFGAGRPRLSWAPRSLRELPPGTVKLTLRCGTVTITETMPCIPADGHERGVRVVYERQIRTREAVLHKVLRVLVRLIAIARHRKPLARSHPAPEPRSSLAAPARPARRRHAPEAKASPAPHGA